MKHLALIAALTLGAAPAMAQTWTTTRNGDQLNHRGYDQNGGDWSATTTRMGDQTITRYRDPSGEPTTCTTMPMGGAQSVTRCR